MKAYNNFINNLQILSQANKQDLTNEFILSGIIYKNRLQFEFACNLWKEDLAYEGIFTVTLTSPREIIKEAYKYFDFMDDEIWLSMLKSRNDLTHNYNGEQAQSLVHTIIKEYIPEFQKMQANLWKIYGDKLFKM